MYVDTGLAGLQALPKWITDLGGRLLSATTVSIPTPAGIPITINLGDRQQLEALREAVTGARVSVGRPAPSPIDEARSAVEEKVPGGWWTIGLGAAAAAGLLWFFLGRRR